MYSVCGELKRIWRDIQAEMDNFDAVIMVSGGRFSELLLQ